MYAQQDVPTAQPITLWDHYAAAALLCCEARTGGYVDVKMTAGIAADLADAMFAERAKRGIK